jgi:Flp pilus assembly protein TadD
MIRRVPRVVGFVILGGVFRLIIPVANAQVLTAEGEFSAGVLAHERGDVDAALQHLQRAVVLDPKMTKAHFAIGTIADLWCGADGDRCGLAIEEYKKALELDPSNREALKDLAYAIYMIEGPDKSEAETYYRKALARAPNDPEVFCGVAAIDAQLSWQDVGLAKIELQLPI